MRSGRELDDESVDLVSFASHWGHYQFTRLPFGTACSAEAFQSKMDRIVEGIPGVRVVFDDILLFGSTIEEHYHRLRLLFERARKSGLKLKLKKLQLCEPKVVFLGHEVTSSGIAILQDRVKAINEMPERKTKQR